MFNTPILFIIFNRPDTAKTVFERIREAKPSRLYVSADGPRSTKPGEAQLCAEARAVIDTVDWPCEVKKLYHDKNLGCGKAVSEAITWFFDAEEMGIILEDDILPDLSFFNYCQTLLHTHKNDQSVMHINGCNFQQGVKRGDGSYYFSAFPHVWGWAGWRRGWQKYDFNLSDLNYFYGSKKLSNYFKSRKIINRWLEIFFRMNRKAIDTWDYQWNYAIWNNGGKVIAPNVNLIKNIGFRPDATHTFEQDSKFANMSTGVMGEIHHPGSKAIDADADAFSFEYTS